MEAEAYLPLPDQIRQTGVTCILVHMPFHMAIFDANAAEEIIPQFPEIRHWYIAGHSMGGAMASKFASEHPDQVDGLILMGAYIYGDYPDETTLTIYGSLTKAWKTTLTIRKTLWKSKAAIMLSSEITGRRKGICQPPFPPGNSRSRRWLPSKPFWRSRHRISEIITTLQRCCSVLNEKPL